MNTNCRYPRFLIHSLEKYQSTSKPYTKSQHFIDSIPHPSKTLTPVVKRVGSSLRPRPTSRPQTHSTPMLLDDAITRRPWTTGDSLPLVPPTTRLLWSRETYRDRSRSSNLFSKLAKYNQYPVIPRSSTAVSDSFDGDHVYVHF